MGILEYIIESNMTESEKAAEKKRLAEKEKDSFNLGGFHLNTIKLGETTIPSFKIRRMTPKEKMLYMLQWDDVQELMEQYQRGEISREEALETMQVYYDHYEEHMFEVGF